MSALLAGQSLRIAIKHQADEFEICLGISKGATNAGTTASLCKTASGFARSIRQQMETGGICAQHSSALRTCLRAGTRGVSAESSWPPPAGAACPHSQRSQSLATSRGTNRSRSLGCALRPLPAQERCNVLVCIRCSRSRCLKRSAPVLAHPPRLPASRPQCQSVWPSPLRWIP